MEDMHLLKINIDLSIIFDFFFYLYYFIIIKYNQNNKNIYLTKIISKIYHKIIAKS
jgi:hypothetical protein